MDKQMMDSPEVTVVIPVYNVEKYLNRCIDSVVSQTYKNLKIILVDDGSADKSGQICEDRKNKDSRISVIHKANAGLGQARNTGFENATGKYIFFVDSDDYIAPETIEKCVDRAEKDKSDAVLFGRVDVYPDGKTAGKPLNTAKPLFENAEITSVLLPGLFNYRLGYGISACMKMFSIDIIRTEGLKFLSEREVVSEDAIFCLDYFSKCRRVSLLPDNLYYYYKNEESLSRQYSPDRQRMNNAFLKSGEEKIRELKLPAVVAEHLRLRYQFYSLAAMKHIRACDMTADNKKAELRKIYKDEHLRRSISFATLRISSTAFAVFMLCIRLKLYKLCDLLLKCKE